MDINIAPGRYVTYNVFPYLRSGRIALYPEESPR